MRPHHVEHEPLKVLGREIGTTLTVNIIAVSESVRRGVNVPHDR